MDEVINYSNLLNTIWTAVLLPLLTYIGKQIYEWLKSKQLDKYTIILYKEVLKVVKSVYETHVKDIKSTSEWTSEKQLEVKELAKAKIVQALTSSMYKILKEANSDFDSYLDSLIGTALYDVKHNNE
ncbi:hypothetical protein LJC58_03850 [Lachnospiraceae bacterium OttesenSCG-928-D06]|nr:hypothetical protein [Lachnospiraceae bacterium OttesenSCG-928-D06]